MAAAISLQHCAVQNRACAETEISPESAIREFMDGLGSIEKSVRGEAVSGTTSYHWHPMRAAHPYAVRERARPLRLHSHRSRPLLFPGRTAESPERRRSEL